MMNKTTFDNIMNGGTLYVYDLCHSEYGVAYYTCSDIQITEDNEGTVYVKSKKNDFKFKKPAYVGATVCRSGNLMIATSEEDLTYEVIKLYRGYKMEELSKLRNLISKENKYRENLWKIDENLMEAYEHMYELNEPNMNDEEFIGYYNSYIMSSKNLKDIFLVKLVRNENDKEHKLDWMDTIKGISQKVLNHEGIKNTLERMFEDYLMNKEKYDNIKYVSVSKDSWEEWNEKEFRATKIIISEVRDFVKQYARNMLMKQNGKNIG